MIYCAEAKLKEDQFLARLRENLVGTTTTGAIQESDILVKLRMLTGGKLLRNELEAKYPLGKSLSVRVTPQSSLFGKGNSAIVVTGKVIVRLDRLVEYDNDDEPISLAELNTILSREADLANRSCYESVLGLYSPTGWAEDAMKFLENNPPSSGWASNLVYPVLIGPGITELVWDKNSGKLKSYIQCFCGLTLVEREQVCKKVIKRAVLVQEFANLSKIATEKGFDMDFVKGVAKELASNGKNLAFSKVPDVGLVLKKTIK